MTALDNLTNRDSWLYETEDYDAGLPEVKEYGGDFSDVALAAAELAALRARVEELEKGLEEIENNLDDELGEWRSVSYDFIPEHLENVFLTRDIASDLRQKSQS